MDESQQRGNGEVLAEKKSMPAAGIDKRELRW